MAESLLPFREVFSLSLLDQESTSRHGRVYLSECQYVKGHTEHNQRYAEQSSMTNVS